MRLPIRARLTIISGALTAAVLVALGAFVYVRFEADLREAVDDGLRSRAEVVLSALLSGGSIATGNSAEPAEAPVQVVDTAGRVIASTPGFEEPQLPPPGVERLEGVYLYDGEFPTNAGPIPIRLVAIPMSGGDLLVVGTSLEDATDALASLAGLLLVGGPVAILLASAVGWVVAGAALRPVERLRTEAEAISASEPGRRLAVPPTGDELARLAESLNRVLVRLEAAVERERRFVGDASHELRTPLANLKAELEIALRRARSPEELTAVLRSASEETDRLVRLSEDLLVLARADGGHVPVRREAVDLGVLINETVAGFNGRALGMSVALDADTPDGVVVDVDPARLRQAIGNLVDNGLRHTPAGGRVAVRVSREAGTAIITVDDTGPGFPPDFLATAFEPFSRSDLARSRTDGGAGLGLAIVRAVAEAHGGSADASNHPSGGARVILRIPVSSA
jgi:heavy metal sensor kinase